MLGVDVESLCVRYGQLAAVRGISLQIPRGEVFGFIGPNDAGKSSTIKVLATLLRDFTGRVKVNGIDVLWRPQAVREKIGYVPDFFGVYEDLTVEEYLHFFAAAYRIDRNRRKAIIGDVLELTDLTHKLHAPVDALSRGTKQRLSLAGVNSVEVQVDRLAIKLHEDQTSIEDLHDHLVGAGARIRMFQPEAMDMETAFMKLTEGKTA